MLFKFEQMVNRIDKMNQLHIAQVRGGFGYPSSNVQSEVNKVIAQIEREEKLDSKNIFTLVSMFYDDPTDVEVIEAIDNLVETSKMWFLYKNRTIYDLLFYAGMICHEITVCNLPATHSAVRHDIDELPSQRDVFNALDAIFNR